MNLKKEKGKEEKMAKIIGKESPIYHGRKSQRITHVQCGVTVKTQLLIDTRFRLQTAFLTARLFRLEMALQVYFAVTALA